MFKRLLILMVYGFFNATTLQAEIQTVVFDFGGVIAQADRTPVLVYFIQTLGLSKEELKEVLEDLHAYVAEGGTDDAFWKEYATSHNINLSDDWFLQLRCVSRNSLKAIPGTLDVVSELQGLGYQTAMLSDISQYRAEIVRELGYYDFFYPVLLSYEIGVEKPDPQAFKILLDKLAIPAADVVFIDDKAENVAAANAQGIHGIQFQNAKQLKRDLSTLGIQWSKE